MYHICDYVRNISYIVVVTVHLSITYKEELNQLRCPEAEYGSRKTLNHFFLSFNNIHNLTGGLWRKIFLARIWAAWFSIKTLHTFLLDWHSYSPRILFGTFICYIYSHNWKSLSHMLHACQGQTYDNINIFKYTLSVVTKTPDTQKRLNEP